MRLLTSLLIAAGACSAQEQANIISSIGNLVSSKRNIALAVGSKVAHFVTAREADRQGKRVKISDQAENTAKYVVWRYAIASVGEDKTKTISNDNYSKMVTEGLRILTNKVKRSKPNILPQFILRFIPFYRVPSPYITCILLKEQIANILLEEKIQLEDANAWHIAPCAGDKNGDKAMKLVVDDDVTEVSK